ncbi:MAG: hypothetical protein ACREQV_06795 [Candidatus Binatia bacterium]
MAQQDRQANNAEAGQSTFPGYKEMTTRLETLTAFASRMRVDCKNDLEKAGDDPVAKIGIIARALGIDAMRALDPAVDLNDVLAPKTAAKR